MMSNALYNQIKSIAAQLTPMEMMRLAGWLEAAADVALRDSGQQARSTQLKDLYGSWSDVHVTDEDIEEVRRDMLSNFPREDV
jgi:hypothetical protein